MDSNTKTKWKSFQGFDFHLNKSSENLEDLRKFINAENYYDAAVSAEFLKDHIEMISKEFEKLSQIK